MKMLPALIVLAGNGVAYAGTLPLPPGYPTLLGASCGGVHIASYVTGFDTNGNIKGEVYAWTRCGGSGRGGGYHTTTYQSWHSITWDLLGNYTLNSYDGVMPDPLFTAADQYGNMIFNVCNGTTNGQPACVASATISYVPPGTTPVSVTVPALLGLTSTQAQISLSGLGLGETPTTQCNQYYASGIVWQQQPVAGTVVQPGTVVNVIISSGLCDGEGD